MVCDALDGTGGPRKTPSAAEELGEETAAGPPTVGTLPSGDEPSVNARERRKVGF
jgi:hypothetical protein